MALQLENLKESNEFLNILFDNITSALFIVDQSAKIENVNDSFSILFQKREDQIVGELCGNALGCVFAIEEEKDCGTTSFCSKCKLRKDILKTMSEKVPTYRNKLSRDFYTSQTKDSKHFLYSTKFIQFHGKKYTLIIVDDHTELEKQKRRLEEQNETLKSLNEQKSKFLGIAAHDLRNPIGAINSFSEILLDSGNEFPDNEKEELLTLIKDSSQFSLQLLNELLDISNIERGKLRLDKNQENISQIVMDVIKINKVFARKKNINIINTVKLKDSTVSLDKSKIEQVLHNLLSNAIKYSTPHTTITVEIKDHSTNFEISVKDQGVGIPESELSKLFTEFGTTSAKTTANESSTGLGLAIAKKIVNGHGGEIMAKSKLNEGSEFLFTLPK
ncbi:sensor histidine kinase [Marinifilum flexuosum]|uniref:histidine kinase n=1 Tax=Marinifilum flexuosum TaxID=1117708 RepID=A0A419WKX8_9BACT|nr:PAS domain-containing sensor histidine kinase [Marinifilum flexuosum]RKD96118.1 phospho-acceptor domain-containing protein [Marinifilum flexuosum]